MPGWYGVANVKWLAEVHLQEDRYLGNYQTRWYRDLRGVGGTGQEDDPQVQWVENEVTRMRLKSVIARVRRTGGALQVLGFVLNDGTPLRSVEVQVDGGAWQKATLDPSNTQYSVEAFHVALGMGRRRVSTRWCRALRMRTVLCSRQPRNCSGRRRSWKITVSFRGR